MRFPGLLIFCFLASACSYFVGEHRSSSERAPEPNSPSNEAPALNSNKRPLTLPTPSTLAGGRLNEKAVVLPEPIYPKAARAAKIGGTVVVQVLVDTNGKVAAASASEGHLLLRSAAETAARRAEFSPVYLGGEPKKVAGVLSYEFTPR